MTPDFDINELGPESGGDPKPITRLAARLQHDRPVPRAAFRGELRRSLLGHERATSRPRTLWLRIAGYGFSGAFLLLVGAFGAAGVGPLAV